MAKDFEELIKLDIYQVLNVFIEQDNLELYLEKLNKFMSTDESIKYSTKIFDTLFVFYAFINNNIDVGERLMKQDEEIYEKYFDFV